ENNLLVQVPIARGIRVGEQAHRAFSGRSVRVRGKRGVLFHTLSSGADGVGAQSAAAEIIVLKISRRLGEAEHIEPVVVPIGPEKKIRYRAGTETGAGRRIASERRWIVAE